ncbi:hypothetical protein [Curtobacterium sp. MCSS17_016]|uniref:hypothetical protein n=1 Tax=Curtobacterium sp. MCSS17_016 TaxID=2175644 RepID=UPI000DA7781D|nr:hypothetical protein [Curtobacterium sp. MCSS17_016]WIE81532.1 hypothetical protein DEJ19_020045 [Curtobacterium sp. MCSS17_016]
MSTITTTVDVAAADIRDVIGFETGTYPVRDQSDRIFRALLSAWAADNEAHANKILAAIPAGLAWATLELRKPQGLATLRTMLERLEDDGDDD